jgi:type IV fimbrial biogenesis protein FimT
MPLSEFKFQNSELNMKIRQRKPGFTLLELILVMLIITIVVGAVAPSLRGFTMGRSASNTATRLLAMTQYARTQAISQGRVYRLTYNPRQRAFWVDYSTLAGDDSDDQRSVPDADMAPRLDVDERLTIDTKNMSTSSAGNQYVEFRPSGRTDPASIVITDQSNQQIEVGCASATELFRIVPDAERTK